MSKQKQMRIERAKAGQIFRDGQLINEADFSQAHKSRAQIKSEVDNYVQQFKVLARGKKEEKDVEDNLHLQESGHGVQ